MHTHGSNEPALVVAVQRGEGQVAGAPVVLSLLHLLESASPLPRRSSVPPQNEQIPRPDPPSCNCRTTLLFAGQACVMLLVVALKASRNRGQVKPAPVISHRMLYYG